MIPDAALSRPRAGKPGARRVRPARGDRLSRLREAAIFVAGGALIAGAAAILVWPLWKLAATNRILYSALVGAVLLAFLSWKLVRRFLSRRTPRRGARVMDPRP